MSQVVMLHHVNGGESQAIQCANCRTYLGNERAISQTNEGVKYFCKMEPGDNPQDSCYIQWAQSHPQLIVRRH